MNQHSMNRGPDSYNNGSVRSSASTEMPKEPRRVPTVLGRVQNGPVTRPSGSVLHFLSLRSTPLESHFFWSRSLGSCGRRFAALVGLSALVPSLNSRFAPKPLESISLGQGV